MGCTRKKLGKIWGEIIETNADKMLHFFWIRSLVNACYHHQPQHLGDFCILRSYFLAKGLYCHTHEMNFIEWTEISYDVDNLTEWDISWDWRKLNGQGSIASWSSKKLKWTSIWLALISDKSGHFILLPRWLDTLNWLCTFHGNITLICVKSKLKKRKYLGKSIENCKSLQLMQ